MTRNRHAALLPVPRAPQADNASKYDPEHCWTVRALAQEGQFPEEWCAEIGVTMWTLYNWANTYPDFEQAMHEAWYLLRAYWARQARLAAQGGSGIVLPTILMEILRKRFPDTWGHNPKATHDHFMARNEADRETANAVGGEKKPFSEYTDLELQVRIKELEERRRISEEFR